VPAQHNDNSSPAVVDQDHPAHPHDKFKFADDADDDSAHPGNAKGKDKAADAVMSDAASDQFIFGRGGHKKVEDTPDRIETDHTVIADIQDALQTAPDTNAVNALDANHTTAAQDMTKVPHHHGDFLT